MMGNGAQQFLTTLSRYEHMIIVLEETTSSSRCGSSFAAFSLPASACPSDRVSQGVFLSSERSQRI